MATYTQTNRPLAVTTPLGKDVLLLVGIQGREAISQLFEFQLELLAKRDAAVAFDRIVGQRATLQLPLPTGGNRYFNGIIRRFEQGGRDPEFMHFWAELVPELWLWTKKVQSRVFQHLTVPDILKQVLDGLQLDVQIKGTFQPRDYCVQYRESDFAFASRLMEEEGIYYYFDHTADSHKLVICDDPLQHPDVADPSTVIYEEIAGGTRKEQRVTEWSKSQEVRSGKYTLFDHCFELTGQNLESQRPVQKTVMAGNVEHKLTAGGNDKLEIYEYPGGFAQRFDGVDKNGGPRPAELTKIFEDGKRTAKIRMEQESAAAVQIRGRSCCEQFAAAHRFSLTRHFDADGKYLLISIEHSARLGDAYRSGSEPTYLYENRFAGIPVGLPYRPPRCTPKPVISGTQTATVVGLPGQELFLDKYGRVKVQFPWDRQGKSNADSSCWLRVSQLWAGNGWGSFFWPRVGQEVVVAFEDGDPDRPLVIGSVYNNTHMPPYELPKAGVLAGIKSCTVRGAATCNYNQILFDDEQGDEYLQLHSEKYVAIHNEHTQHEFMPATNFRVVGNPGVPKGSGGGGGLLQDIVIGAWHPGASHVESGQYQYIFGDNVQMVSRSLLPSNNLQWVYGTNIQGVFDPLSLVADAIPGLGPVVELFGVNGSLQTTYGNNLQCFYGVGSQVTRGPQINYATNPLIYVGGTAWETAIAIAVHTLALLAAVTGIVLTAQASQIQVSTQYPEGRNDLGSTTNWVIGLIWGLIVVLEQGASRLFPGKGLSQEALQLVSQGLTNPQNSSLHVKQATQNLTESASLLLAALMKPSDMLSSTRSSTSTFIDSHTNELAFVGPGVRIVAVRDPSDEDANKGSDIVIDAEGSNNDGSVLINASKELVLACGPGRLIMKSDGTICLHSTKGPGAPVAIVQLTPDAKISMVSAGPAGGAVQTMTPEAHEQGVSMATAPLMPAYPPFPDSPLFRGQTITIGGVQHQHIVGEHIIGPGEHTTE
jgi:type VI secretion system secreted protein VgrG